MNIATLKAFAPAVRRQLMEAITRKLDFVLSTKTPDYLSTFAPQVASLRKLSQEDRSGLIERVAYTWFNRLTALRFLDARGWHPFGARVLTPAGPTETRPEVLKLIHTGTLPKDLQSHTNLSRLDDLLDGRIPSPDPQGEVYRHLVLASCRFYHALLPDVFEKLDDETELLLPDDLLTEHSVVQGFRTEISDEDCGDEHANVEILGWLYQFYISERKDQVMARKTAVPTEDIPAVTQLFTPHWIVRYLVENSLGRLWLRNHPGSKLREQMPYYIETEPETDFLGITKPEEIRLLDPAAGSGHMLTYAFDLLALIYEEEGYAPSEIPALILRHNLYGLEICPRAAQLAELALVFKARETSRRFFFPEQLVRPNIIELREIRFAENELRDYIRSLGLGDLFDEPMLRLLHQFEETKTFGSLIQPCLNEETISFARRAIEVKDLGSQLFLYGTHVKVLRAMEQADALTQRYHIVVTNPPYMGANGMNGVLRRFAKDIYADSKSDLFAMFIERSFTLTLSGGFSAMVTMQSWMFLASYEQLRATVLGERSIRTLIQIGYNSFPEMNSKIAQACAFAAMNAPQLSAGIYVNLNDAHQAADKERVYLDKLKSNEFFRASADGFRKIPGSPIAYWVSETLRSTFDLPKLRECFTTREGMATADNPRFLRNWSEVSLSRIAFHCRSESESASTGGTWFPYNKGGTFRRWYGNNEWVVEYANAGENIKSNYDPVTGRLRSHNFNGESGFREGLTWSALTSGPFSIRHSPAGFLFDSKGAKGFSRWNLEILGLLNSCVAHVYLKILSPTLDFKVGDVIDIPWVKESFSEKARLLASESTELARWDWDNFEISWDFCDHPLLRPSLKGATLHASWRNWEAQSTNAIQRMQELETENNRFFIAAYGLDGELQPAVPEGQITISRANARSDIAAFLSYVVGSMMGRYSLDHPGLILANAGDSFTEFLKKVGRPQEKLTFVPNENGIVPILEGEWFEDDIVARTRDFLRATFGEATLRENVHFIEDSLGKDLRKYFLTDFYKDHLQTYKKRPIYWLVQSPRKGFSVLIYLHRYTRDTMNLVLNRYLREFQAKLRGRLAHLAQTQISATISTRDKTAARKEQDRLTKTLHECEDWERETLLPLAQARIDLDLDDGVKTNYLKLGEALAPIPGLAMAEED